MKALVLSLLLAGLGEVTFAGEIAVAPANAPFCVQFGMGYEASTSPFINISDDGLFLSVNGQSRLTAAYLQGIFSGMDAWQLGAGQMAWSLRAEDKHAPSAPNLDFGSVMGDLSWHLALPNGASVGVGAGLQRMWVAQAPFRDAVSLHADGSIGQPDGGYWLVAADLTKNQHFSTYVDLNSDVLSVSVTHRKPVAWAGLDGLDFEAGYARDRNARGLDDLSHQRVMVRVAADSKFQNMTWTGGLAISRSKYDISFIPGVPVRRDRMLAWEMGVAWDMGRGRTLALDADFVVNKGNSNLFDNTYRNLAMTWSQSW